MYNVKIIITNQSSVNNTTKILQYFLQYFHILQYSLQYFVMLQYQRITILCNTVGTAPVSTTDKKLFAEYHNETLNKKVYSK